MYNWLMFATVILAAALGSMTPAQAIDVHSYLVGTWNCTYTVGDRGGTYTTTWSKILDGMWLRQTYDQKKQPRAEPFKAEYFIGYDPRYDGWVRFGVMTTGQYFLIRMEQTPDGWGWTYLNPFSKKPRETTRYDTVFARKSDTFYTVDGPTYPGPGGVSVTEHHQCRKAGA